MIVQINLLDDDINKDKIYQLDNISLVNLQRDSQRFKSFSNYALYILLGHKKRHNREIYVGQTSNIGQRLQQHKAGKSFWVETIFFIKNEGSFSKDDILWLEQNTIKKLIDLGYFKSMQNCQIPKITLYDDQRLLDLKETEKIIVLLLKIFNGLDDHENENQSSFTEDAQSGNTIIKRIAKSYADYASEAIDQFNDYDEEYGINEMSDAKYFELGNGKVMIFKNSKLNGKIPKKYKDKVKDKILLEDIVVDNMIRAKEIIG